MVKSTYKIGEEVEITEDFEENANILPTSAKWCIYCELRRYVIFTIRRYVLVKKRAMKKWIPKKTCYCYSINKNRKVSLCKWLVNNPNKEYQLSGYCKYLKEGDWFEHGTNLLFDQCKECSVSQWYDCFTIPK